MKSEVMVRHQSTPRCDGGLRKIIKRKMIYTSLLIKLKNAVKGPFRCVM